MRMECHVHISRYQQNTSEMWCGRVKMDMVAIFWDDKQQTLFIFSQGFRNVTGSETFIKKYNKLFQFEQ